MGPQRRRGRGERQRRVSFSRPRRMADLARSPARPPWLYAFSGECRSLMAVRPKRHRRRWPWPARSSPRPGGRRRTWVRSSMRDCDELTDSNRVPFTFEAADDQIRAWGPQPGLPSSRPLHVGWPGMDTRRRFRWRREGTAPRADRNVRDHGEGPPHKPGTFGEPCVVVEAVGALPYPHAPAGRRRPPSAIHASPSQEIPRSW